MFLLLFLLLLTSSLAQAAVVDDGPGERGSLCVDALSSSLERLKQGQTNLVTSLGENQDSNTLKLLKKSQEIEENLRSEFIGRIESLEQKIDQIATSLSALTTPTQSQGTNSTGLSTVEITTQTPSEVPTMQASSGLKFYFGQKLIASPSLNDFRSECIERGGAPGFISPSDWEAVLRDTQAEAKKYSTFFDYMRFRLPLKGLTRESVKWLNGEVVPSDHPLREKMEAPDDDSGCWWMARDTEGEGWVIFDWPCGNSGRVLCKIY